MRRAHRHAPALLTITLLCTTSGFVRAQAPAADQAAKHYQEGNRLYDEGQLAGAEAAYERAWAIRRGYDVALNLGAVELDQKKHREAAEHLSYALSTFPAGGKPEARAQLEARLALVMQYVARLELTVSVPTARILVDGGALHAAGDPVFLDPGEHALEASATGYRPWSRRLKLATNTTHRIAIELVAVADVPPNGQDDDEGPARWLVPAIAGGAGLAAIGLSIGFAVSAGSAQSDAEAQAAAIVRDGGRCEPVTPGFETPCGGLSDSVDTHDGRRDLAVAMGITGGVLVASAGTALLVWPSAEQRPASVKVMPIAGAGQAGVGFSGRF